MEALRKYFTTILKDKKTKARWRILAMTMACVIVFSTTYSLILPAITMDQGSAEETAGFDGDLLLREHLRLNYILLFPKLHEI